MKKSPASLKYFYLMLCGAFSSQPAKLCGRYVEHNLINIKDNNNYGILGGGLKWRFASKDLKDYIREIPLLCENLSKISCKYNDEYFKRDSVCLNYTLSELKWGTRFVISSNNTCEDNFCFLKSDPKKVQRSYGKLHTLSEHPKAWSELKNWASQFVPKTLPDPSAFTLSVKYVGRNQAEIWMRMLQIKATITHRYQNLVDNVKPTETINTFYLPLKYLGDGIIINFGVLHL